MSGLWRGWNLICTSCSALKKYQIKKRRHLWLVYKSSRKVQALEKTCLNETDTLGIHTGIFCLWWKQKLTPIQLYHPVLAPRGVSQPQHHAGLLPVGTSNAPQLKASRSSSSLSSGAKETGKHTAVPVSHCGIRTTLSVTVALHTHLVCTQKSFISTPAADSTAPAPWAPSAKQDKRKTWSWLENANKWLQIPSEQRSRRAQLHRSSISEEDSFC